MNECSQPVADTAVHPFDDWFDPIEVGVRDRVRGYIQVMVEGVGFDSDGKTTECKPGTGSPCRHAT